MSDSPKCPTCGYVMCEDFDERGSLMIPNGKYICYHCKKTEPMTTPTNDLAARRPTTIFWPLFEHMAQDHGLHLLESELAEIVHVVEQMRVEWGRENGRLRDALRWIADRDQQGDIRAVAREAISDAQNLTLK